MTASRNETPPRGGGRGPGPGAGRAAQGPARKGAIGSAEAGAKGGAQWVRDPAFESPASSPAAPVFAPSPSPGGGRTQATRSAPPDSLSASSPARPAANPRANPVGDRGANSGRAPRALMPGANLPLAGPPPRVLIGRAPLRADSVGRAAARRAGWRMVFEPTRAPRREPLMGWLSSDDPLAGLELRFDDLDAAIDFAERRGWEWTVLEPPPRAPRR
ncbi:ETC complex I subunit-like protein [Oceanicella actignis]|nr:ETC complex I subunit-like protein [Oceanicella actignis]